MITDLFLSIFGISVATGATAALCMLLLPLLNRRYAAKWSYYIWIFLALRLLLPVNGQTVVQSAQRAMQAFSKGQETQQGNAPADVVRRQVVIEVPPQMTVPLTGQQEERGAVSVLDLAAGVWLLGCAVSLLFPVCSYCRYRKRIREESRGIADAEFCAQALQQPGNACEADGSGAGGEETICLLMHRLSEELHIKRLPSVRIYEGSISPMVVGVFRPILLLPDYGYGAQELYFILKHELIHLKRHDVAVKFLFLAANSIHWFNPLIYLMRRRAVVDMEFSCDERVIRGIAYADRKAYTETLFTAIQAAGGRRNYLSTQFYGGKKIMKKRFKNIFTRVRKRNGLLLLSGAVLITTAVGTLVSCGVDTRGTDNDFNTVIMRTGTENVQKGMSDEELCKRAGQYFAVHHDGMMPGTVEIDGVTDAGLVQIHLYDTAEDNSATMTLDWYTVDRETGIGENVNFEPVNLMDLTLQANDPTKEELLAAQMAGTWAIDFDRTKNLWGSGISYGNEMVIGADAYGSFRYYIGIGVGGTGQCEADGDALRVEVERYEDNSEGAEVLTLRYVTEDGGEWILMDWYGEEVYWKRAVASAETQIVLTFLKEGMEEHKQAQLTQGDGFGIYLPVDEWQANGPDTWTSVWNERVNLWVTPFDEVSEEGAWQELERNGFSFENGVMSEENGESVLRVRLFTTENRVWGVFYRYPAEAEEGWEPELSAIADTFFEVYGESYSVKEETSESKALSMMVEEFAAAYFAGDSDTLKDYLAGSFAGSAETYSGPGTAQIMAVRGLGTDRALPAGSTKDVSVEFLDSTEDSYTYLSMRVVKQEDGWKVQSYGLEK